MSKEINLLPVAKERKGSGKGAFYRIRLAGVVLLATVMGVTLLLLVVAQIMVAVQKDTNRRLVNAKEAVTTYKDKEVLARLVKDKVAGLSVVLADRFDFPSLFTNLEKILPPEAVMTGLTAGKDGQVSTTVRVPSSKVLGAYLTSVQSFDNILVESISGNKDGGYDLVVNFHAQ